MVEISHAAQAAEDSLTGTTVAIIDDDVELLWATTRILESWGCRVLAGSSLEEIEAGMRNLEDPPDWIIADYRLRGSLTGSEAIRRLRARARLAVPAIIITGDCGPEPVHASERYGHQLLRKPVRPEALRRVLSVRSSSDGSTF
jgi:CheY-like chemotaxis protein